MPENQASGEHPSPAHSAIRLNYLDAGRHPKDSPAGIEKKAFAGPGTAL
jgi:hypothetical protein